MKAELERIRDQLKCSLNMGGLKGAAEWVVGELDRLLSSLPVGVPDASELQRVIYSADAAAKRMLDADSFWWSEIATIRVEFERFMRSMLAAVHAAPTVKAEQVQCLYCQGHGDVTRVSGQTAESYSEHNEECPECKGTGLAPSLPAAGSDVEEVKVVGHLSHCVDGYDPDAPPPPPQEPLMTVTQCLRMLEQQRAALSAQQSAPERVSVPVELLLGTGNSLVLTPLSRHGKAWMTIPAPDNHKRLLEARAKYPTAASEEGEV